MYVQHLDVRSILLAKGNPFKRITETVSGLADDGIFELRTTFRPTPLYRYLNKKGFSHATIGLGKADFLSQFYRNTDDPQFVIDVTTTKGSVLPLTELLRIALEDHAHLSVVVLVERAMATDVLHELQAGSDALDTQFVWSDADADVSAQSTTTGCAEATARTVRIEVASSRAG
jgi:hypothetical protein